MIKFTNLGEARHVCLSPFPSSLLWIYLISGTYTLLYPWSFNELHSNSSLCGRLVEGFVWKY